MLRHRHEAIAAKFDLRAADLRILMVVDRAVASGGIRIREVATILNFTSGGISKRLDGLERKGLVIRSTHADDARAVDLLLTERGVEIVRELRAENAHDPHALSEAEWQQLNALLRKLGERWTNG